MQYNAMCIIGLERKRRNLKKETRRIGFYVEVVISLRTLAGARDRGAIEECDSPCRESAKMQVAGTPIPKVTPS
jgi:hypothetical protein